MRLATLAMGTRFEIALVPEHGRTNDASLRAAGEAAIDEINDWHRRLTRFTPESFLSHLNRAAGREPVRLDDDLYALIADALTVWRDSAGAFDITVAPAMAARGFAPSAVEIEAARPDGRAMTLDPATRTLHFTAPLSLDLGGIAKGHALDCAAGVLRRHGVTSAFLHGGTSSGLAMGLAPDDLPWRVALDEAGGRAFDLRDDAFSMSDPLSQIAETGEGHLVDPRRARTGADPSNAAATRRVLVIGSSARLADAWSTALAILGQVPPEFPASYTAQCV